MKATISRNEGVVQNGSNNSGDQIVHVHYYFSPPPAEWWSRRDQQSARVLWSACGILSSMGAVLAHLGSPLLEVHLHLVAFLSLVCGVTIGWSGEAFVSEIAEIVEQRRRAGRKQL